MVRRSALREALRTLACAGALGVGGCATLDTAPRAATSPLGCVQTASRDIATGQHGDKRAHCLVAARIARRCSVSEATLAAYGKELRDLFTRGNAELADLRASRRGVACARAHGDDALLARCCAASGY